MLSDYLQATSEKNENGLAFKRFKNSVNGFFGENGLDAFFSCVCAEVEAIHSLFIRGKAHFHTNSESQH